MAKERRSGVEVFTKSLLKKAVKYLLENSYFEFRNRTFREIIGILMVSDPAPFFTKSMKVDGFVRSQM